jgi:Terpene synthase family 2, C-terminal metal binding
MHGYSSLPPLACPFPAQVSPHAAAVERHVVDWAQCFMLLPDQAEADRFRQARVGRLAARTSPDSDLALLELLADWQMWLFIFDDRYCDESVTGAHPERLARIITPFLSVLENAGGRRAGTSKLTVALADIMQRLSVRATDTQVFRFISAVRGYFLAQFWESAHRVDDKPAALAEYQVMRRHGGAVPTCVALIDVAGGFELPSGEFGRRDVRELTDIAVNVTCWANDVLSYQKESARSLTVHSLPAVLAHELKLDIAAALTSAAALHDAEVNRYVKAEPMVRGRAGPELRRYLDGLRNWMAGNFYWSRETGRYGLLGDGLAVVGIGEGGAQPLAG